MIQKFAEENVVPAFHSETEPQLHYLGKVLPEISSFPRVMHSHPDYVEISIIYSGQSRYMIADQWQTIQEGDVIIYNAGVVHDELTGYKAQIGSYFFAIGSLKIPGLPENALIGAHANPVFHIRHGFDTVKILCEQMILTQDHPTIWSKYVSHTQTLALLEIIWRIIHLEKQPQEKSSAFHMGRKIKDYLDAHYQEQLSLDRLSEELHLSKSYISHTFKDMMGYSPMQYALREKIGEAQTLLISTDYPVTEIAHKVGFDIQSHFDQRFRQYVGISPSKFRKAYRQNAEAPQPSVMI